MNNCEKSKTGMAKHPDLEKIESEVILFLEYQIPHGALQPCAECHALFYYYLLAQRNYEMEKDVIILDGQMDPHYHYHQLFKSIATMYGVQPENMQNFWGFVDKQCELINLPKLPDLEKYRFNRKLVIN